jgi:hypothetical protein
VLVQEAAQKAHIRYRSQAIWPVTYSGVEKYDICKLLLRQSIEI